MATRTLFLPSPTTEELAQWQVETVERVESNKPVLPPGDTDSGGINLPGWSIQQFRTWRDLVAREARSGANLTTPQEYARVHGIHPPVVEVPESEALLAELAAFRRGQTESQGVA